MTPPARDAAVRPGAWGPPRRRSERGSSRARGGGGFPTGRGDAVAPRRARDDGSRRRPPAANDARPPRRAAGFGVRFGLAVGLAAMTLPATAHARPARPTGAGAATPVPPPEPAPLSAYFGLDDALPVAANALCPGAAGLDGMPVVFPTEIDDASLQPDDFAVVAASGAVHAPQCATLRPAIDPGERRTVLLIGQFGDGTADPPARVEIVDELRAADGSGRDYRGASVPAAPLAAGPMLVAAAPAPPTQWRLGQPAGPQRGDGCPTVGTEQVVRVTWAGGVTNRDGADPTAAEQRLYRVALRGSDGGEHAVAPLAVADLGDGDNHHLLCLDAAGTPLSVSFPAGHLYDPNRDAPNPDTAVPVAAAPAAT